MINNYGEKLENLYLKIRNDNLNEQIKRKKYIEQTYPRLFDLEKNIMSLYLNTLKLNNKNLIDEIKQKISILKNEKQKILKSINLPSDYLDSIYTCKKCKDTGYILTNKCTCFFKNLSAIYLNDPDLNQLIKDNNFDNFNFSYYSNKNNQNNNLSPNENIKNIYSNILNYIKNFNSININLLFTGECGSGKTFLSHCIANELLKKGFLVIYLTSEDLFKELFSNYSSKNNDNKFNNLIMNCDLLIIDDLGTESSNPIYNSILFNFLNKKIMLNKKMLISTNLTLRNLQQNYFDRICSRIFGEFTIFNFFVDQDIRIQKKINRVK